MANSRDGKRPIPVCLAASTRSHVGAGAVPGLEERELPGGGVGGHALVAPAVDSFHQADLGAGMGSYPADQDPHPYGPASVGEAGKQPGQLRDRGARQAGVVDRAGLTGRVDRDRPRRTGQQAIASLTWLVTVNPTENDTCRPCSSRRPRRWFSHCWWRRRRRCGPGSDARAAARRGSGRAPRR